MLFIVMNNFRSILRTQLPPAYALATGPDAARLTARQIICQLANGRQTTVTRTERSERKERLEPVVRPRR